jgi:LCP family protein required for cell wall assembly
MMHLAPRHATLPRVQGPTTPEPGQPWGPTVRGGRPSRRRWLVILLVLVLLLPMTYGGVMLVRLSTAMDRVPVNAFAGSRGGPMHILVTGSDSRADLTPEERRELTTGGAPGERTDSIFVLTVERGRAAILAFPRDLYVTRCDGSRGRINAALAIGGEDCLVQTVQDLSGIPLHHYVQITFGGFRNIVDAVGGVELCLDRAINDRKAGIDLPAGCQRLGGADALGFVRTRAIDSDFGRIKRQQQFLAALARELATPATVLNPLRSYQAAGAIGGAMRTDDDMGPIALARLALGVRALAGGQAIAETVPATGATIGGASVLEIQQAPAEELFAAFRTGRILDQAGGEVTREETRVRVLNGAGIGGLAGNTRDALQAQGYDVVGIGDTDPTDTSVIRYPPGQRANAELLASDLPFTPRLEEAAGDSLTLILGGDAGGG